MDIDELKNEYPGHTWSGGIDSVYLMEGGTPEMVAAKVKRQIIETDVLNTGGMIVATSSEINSLINASNFFQ